MVLKDQPGDKYCAIRYDPVHELVYGGRYATKLRSKSIVQGIDTSPCRPAQGGPAHCGL